MRTKIVLSVAIALVAANVCAAESGDSLATLRETYAREWFKPEAHLRLAKHLAENGQRLTAFYISETARRGHFPEEIFDAAVRRVYLDDPFDNGAEAEKELRDQLEAKPEDEKLLTALADIHLSRGEWKPAESLLRKALAVNPESDAVWPLAEVLRRDGREADGDRLEKEWLAGHPDSVEAWGQKIDAARRTQNPDALKIVNAALEKYPEEASLHFTRAQLLHRIDDVEGAAAAYIHAAGLAPRSAQIQGWTARFFLKAVGDRGKALEYYLNAYFLDPHFYDTEHAEGRIRTLAYERGSARFAAALAAGARPLDLLADADPVVVAFAIEEVNETWTPEALPKLLTLLAHDDGNIRYPAANAIAAHVGAEFDEQLRALLQHADLRVRSAAAYIAGARWKENVVPVMKAWLEDRADLMRYDAVSVLLEFGGDAGKAEVLRCAASGACKDARLQAIVTAIQEPVKTPD